MGKLATQLELRRFDKNFQLLEYRKQKSRSFTIGLMDLLYEMMLPATQAAPVSAVTVDRVTISIDNYDPSTLSLYYSWITGNGRVASPGGFSVVQDISRTAMTNGGAIGTFKSVPGCDLGIVVGVGNTAVTPTDRRLYQQNGHGVRPADGGDILFDSYNGAVDDADGVIYDINWRAHGFVPYQAHRIYSVKLKLWKNGAPPNDLIVEIRGLAEAVSPGITAEGPVTARASVLATANIAAAGLGGSPGAYVAATFATPIDVLPGHVYYIVCHTTAGTAGNCYEWRYDNTSATYTNYPVAVTSVANELECIGVSGDSGATWTLTNNKCHMFEEYGRSVGDFEIGGCDVKRMTVANPNASMIISRFFTNRSGATINVAEVGICAGVSRQDGTGSQGSSMHSILIARDVVGPAVVVLDTELLLVTYTPAIVV